MKSCLLSVSPNTHIPLMGGGYECFSSPTRHTNDVTPAMGHKPGLYLQMSVTGPQPRPVYILPLPACVLQAVGYMWW